jgi:hypothetical protein
LYWQDENGQGITDDTFTENISNSGAGFTTRHRLVAGARIYVNLNIEGKSGTSIGTVRWAEIAAEGYRIGVSFQHWSRHCL